MEKKKAICKKGKVKKKKDGKGRDDEGWYKRKKAGRT